VDKVRIISERLSYGLFYDGVPKAGKDIWVQTGKITWKEVSVAAS